MTREKKIPKNKSEKYLIIFLLVLIAFFALAYLTRNQSLYAPRKDDVKIRIQNALDSVDFPGTPVFSEIEDEGCDARNSVGLALYIHCDFNAYKYYQGRALSEDLKAADLQLTKNGWSRDLYFNQTMQEFEQVLLDNLDHQIRYSKDSTKIILGFYKSPTEVSEYPIEQLIARGKITAPDSDHHIYGVRIDTSYWSCRHDSFFTQGCPQPPSEPK